MHARRKAPNGQRDWGGEGWCHGGRGPSEPVALRNNRHIIGFSATASNSDVIDLVGIDFNAAGFAANYASGVLGVTDGTHSASLTLDYFDNVLNFTSDGHGGTLVTDQPWTIATGGSLEISKFSIGTVNFGGATGSLTLDNPALFSGHIQNFASNDSIDIAGINFAAPGFAETYNDTTGQLSLTMARTVRASPSTTSTTC